MTLAALVRAAHPEWSWNKCREAIAKGRVSVAGEVVTDHARRFPEGTGVAISARGTRPAPALPAIHVYFHDPHLIVVEKPSGVESVPFETRKSESRRDANAAAPTLIDLARRWLEATESRKLPPLRIVHRIDKGTSGILVFARTPAAEKGLGRQFRDHSITRKYLAICGGTVKSGTIKSRLIEDRGDGYRGSTHHKELGKPAVTHVDCLATTRSGYSLIACRLETGRTHQIRIHLCESGHPLCGDSVYRRPARGDADLPDMSRAPRLALHAAELGFTHPASGKTLHFSSPFPDDLRELWKSLGGNHRDDVPT
jgi:23S rRNA pseudouridine1911/1915/1917 synthase